MNHKIIYNDFAPLAADNATVPADGSSAYQSGGELLNEDKRDTLNYASFEGRGINLADGSMSFAESEDNLGFVSSAISGANRRFSNAVRLVISLSGGVYPAPGITFHFWQNYCTKVSIKWLNNSELLSEKTFYPTSLDFYGENAVNRFNKVIIDFEETETAFQFVKLSGIDLGRTVEITKFFGAIHVYKEISPDCSDLPGSTCEFEARAEGFSPQEAQELYLYTDGELIGKFSVDTVESSGQNRFNFECSNDVMRLDGAPFSALSQGNYTAAQIAAKIKEASNITVDTGDFSETAVSGFIESGKKARLALAMLSFATGCFVASDGKLLKLLKPRNRRNKLIGSNRIFGEAKYKPSAPFSALTMTTYSGNFDTVKSNHKYSNPAKRANSSVGKKEYDKYSLIGNTENRFEEIKESGFYRNEVTATIIPTDERVGDIISIETPYNGIITGIVKSMDITLPTAITAEITLIERGYAANGGEA